MTNSRFLELQIALLLTEFGKDPVLAALANKLNLAEVELLSQIEQAGEKAAKKNVKRGRAKADPVERAIGQHPEKSEHLRVIVNRYQSREFLPTLRDVERFLDQHSVTLDKKASRVKALPRVVKVLADLSIPDLEKLCEPNDLAGRSSLGMISDEILRREKS